MSSGGFSNPVVGGGGALVYPSIHSPNYIAGTSGWTINKDGSAEFNNGTFRGVVVDGGMFTYNGTPGSGNPPVFSITKPGTVADPFGNAVIANAVTTYNSHGAVINCLSMGNSAFFQYLDKGSAVQGAMILAIASTAGNDPVLATAYVAGMTGIDPTFGDSIVTVGTNINFQQVAYTRSAIVAAFTAADNAHQAREQIDAPEQGAASHAQLQLLSESQDTTKPAQTLLAAVAGSAVAIAATKALLEVQGVISAQSPGGTAAPVPVTQSDHSTFTITGTGNAQASKSWSIPANDANVDTVYRLTVWGFGTEGTTSDGLIVGISLAGTVIRSGQLGGLTASGAFRFRCVIDMHIVTTGAGGTADVNAVANWATTAGPTVAGSVVIGSAAAAGEAFNTTIANVFRLSLAWAASTGSPTITTVGSTFERIGP